MKLRIKEFARLVGVSVRTLHYYDEIGLLKPSAVDGQNGYRYYGNENLERMEQIMFYRELDFPLKKIAGLLDSTANDRRGALAGQKELLELKKQRLERLISAIDASLKGEKIMDKNIFDNSEYENAREKYEKEVNERWGQTAAFKEYKRRSHSENDMKMANEALIGIFEKFAKCRADGGTFSGNEAQLLVKELKNCISENFYECTDEILKGLGEMYVSDNRFKAFIDKSGVGTAEFISKAISKAVG